MKVANSLIEETKDTLEAMNEGVAGVASYLRNRAVTVSLILLAWRRNIADGGVPPDPVLDLRQCFHGTARVASKEDESVQRGSGISALGRVFNGT